MMYNLDTEEWYKQKTTYIDNNLPITRTRFCGQTVYSNSTNTWEYAAAPAINDIADTDCLTAKTLGIWWTISPRKARGG